MTRRSMPVSHTHLDVYKRQVLPRGHASFARAGHVPAELLRLPFLGRRGGHGPVSYTHLDVYKRQRKERAMLKQHRDQQGKRAQR